ncbi:MarR family winged helix-turn-helix transcriptional regulator [Coraliomargarita akajimensis]|nr:MarR family transcriptional regulator [Coraliomargarita akajimensis]
MAKIYQHSGPHLFLLMWKASHAVMSYDHASIAKSGFKSLSDFAVLEFLLHKGPQPVNTIGERILLTSGSITTAVQRLEKRGLVRRERGKRDARVVMVHLTEDGDQLIRESFERHTENLDHLFEPLTEEERQQFATLMRKVGTRAAALNG